MLLAWICPRAVATTRTSSCGFHTGSIVHSRAFIMLKIAVLARIPNASESIAVAVNPGLMRITRSA